MPEISQEIPNTNAILLPEDLANDRYLEGMQYRRASIAVYAGLFAHLSSKRESAQAGPKNRMQMAWI
jgi:hypothetical protein